MINIYMIVVQLLMDMTAKTNKKEQNIKYKYKIYKIDIKIYKNKLLRQNQTSNHNYQKK